MTEQQSSVSLSILHAIAVGGVVFTSFRKGLPLYKKLPIVGVFSGLWAFTSFKKGNREFGNK